LNTPSDPNSPLVIREYPIFQVLFGLIFSGVGLYIAFGDSRQLLFGMLFFSIGLAVALFLGAIVTITVDKTVGLVSIVSQYIWRRKYEEYEIKDIVGVEVSSRQSHSRRGGSTTVYGVQLLLADGQNVDLFNTYSSGRSGKEKTAQKLRDYLGLLDAESARSMMLASSAAGQPGFQPANPQQAAGAAWVSELQAGQSGELAYNVTNGVRWQVTDRVGGGSEFNGMRVLRWFSPDFKLPYGFLYLVQKPKGSPVMGTSGLLGGLSMTLYRASLRLFGFDDEHTPGLEQAALLKSLDPRLEDNYMALSTDEYGARQLLNPWATMPLARWAENHPLKQIQSSDAAGQLAVLFSPLCVYVACIGLPPAQHDALTELGVELVKAQGGGADPA